MEKLLRELGFDRYERQARLKPALLVLLPALVTLAVWQPRIWTTLSGLASLLVGCGLTFLLAKVARYRGRIVERDLVARYGGRLTQAFLRHRDLSLSPVTKARYHAFLVARDFPIPSPAEERVSPREADGHYRAGVDWLLEATRDEKAFPLVKDELIDYGFRRNLLGLKPIGILVALTVLAAHLWLAVANLGADETRFWTAAAVAIAMAGVVGAWTFVVRMPFVEDASRSYAFRLLAACDVIAAGGAGKARERNGAESGRGDCVICRRLAGAVDVCEHPEVGSDSLSGPTPRCPDCQVQCYFGRGVGGIGKLQSDHARGDVTSRPKRGTLSG